MYEKTLNARILALLAAAIAALVLVLFYQIGFPYRFVPFYSNINGHVSHFMFISLFILIWLSYVLATLPGAYLLRRERVPRYVIISLFSATLTLGLKFPVAQLLFPFVGRGILDWASPMVMFAAYLVGFELFSVMSRRKAFWIAGGVVALTFLVNVALYFFWL